jgi:hypothetical protein
VQLYAQQDATIVLQTIYNLQLQIIYKLFLKFKLFNHHDLKFIYNYLQLYYLLTLTTFSNEEMKMADRKWNHNSQIYAQSKEYKCLWYAVYVSDINNSETVLSAKLE